MSHRPLPRLEPGDVLLYKPRGLFGWAISIKTFRPIAHVEVYDGDGFAVASRDGRGVDRYPFRESGLAYVLRPIVPFKHENANLWFTTVQGRPYSWVDLLNFFGFSIDTRGMFCSEFATLYLRAGGVTVFPTKEPAWRIAPGEFLLSAFLEEVWPEPAVELVA